MHWTTFTDTPMKGAKRSHTCYACAHNNSPSEIPSGIDYVKRCGKLVDGDGVESEMTVDLHAECAANDSCQGQSAVADGDSVNAGEVAAAVGGEATSVAEATAVSLEERLEHEHYQEIRALNREVSGAYFAWEAAKEDAASKRKTLDAMFMELRQLIGRGPDPQMPLFDKAPEDAAAAPVETWQTRSLSVLAISDSLAELLEEQGLATLGEMKQFWDDGKLLGDLKGIGGEKSAKVAAAWADYVNVHPEVYGEDIAADNAGAMPPDNEQAVDVAVLGDTGAGKTTMGLMPLIAQLMRFGDSSVVVIDLKADKQFFFESLKEEAARVPEWVQNVPKDPNRIKCADYPFRWFTTLLGRSSYAFNPLAQRVMPKLTPDQRTDILTAAMGLQYGTDYGRKYFGDANYEVLNYALRENPNVGSLSELERILAGANRFPLPDETRRAGTHVLSSVRRLARLKALNACPAIGTPQSVLDAAIDLDDVFSQPQVLYFALPASSGVSNTAELARIVLYSLLSAAQAHEGRRTQVYLVVDEFQRIVSNNVELFLQQARSMNIGCILANQSLGDLLRVDADLVSAVRTNTRFRQIFGAGSSEDIRDIVETSGEMVQGMRTWNYAPGIFHMALQGLSIGESVRPRLSVNDILKATDAPGRSVTTIRRGESYAQYGGFPFIMDSVHHIPQDEFQRREDESWPAQTPATVIATLDDYATPLPNPAQILGDGKASVRPPSGSGDEPAPDGADNVNGSSDDGGRIDAAAADGVTMSFLDAMYQEQQEKARAHLAKRKKKTRRNTDS